MNYVMGGQITHSKEKINGHKIVVGKRDNLKEHSLDGRIILKFVLIN